MNASHSKVRKLFDEALRLSEPGARVRYLDQACGLESPLRRELDSLLRAHEQAGDFLGRTVQVPVSDFSIEPTGMKIGRYKLLEKIGEGGFGIVYMAEQTEPVQRKVALKLIKSGMDTREVIARFEAERQALALMEHPNIARVLDAGATEAGRPYFVMELVRGISITEYCDQKQLSTTERLELFTQVCRAVQHAHQKGIIHRDLKPSNVLVTLHDGEPVPKVIDFGIAKALGGKLTQKTLFTGFAHMVGTPAYMSPEQAEMSGLDIDTRADVYSLGVLLYELLTGSTPFDANTLRRAALDEVRRMIREDEPPKPSTRLRTLGEKFTEVAHQRQTEPAALSRLVRGDLDWIVMKCLEKDRRRRYETPDALAGDVARHLQNQPVMAYPPSAAYLVFKFIRRHRVAVSVSAALTLTVLAGVGVSVWQAVRASRQAALAESRRAEAEASRQAAADARQRAERSAREVSHQLAREYVDKGIELLDSGDNAGSLLWFAEALRLDEGDPAAEALHRLRLGTVLQQGPTVLNVFLHRKEAISVEFSADGRRLLIGGDKTARIWDTATGASLAAPLTHENSIVGASFSPDGQKVVTASFDYTARIWNAATGAPLTPPMTHASNVWSAVFSPDGRQVVTASDDHTARVWDATTGQPVTPALQHDGPVWPAAFSPDGRWVVTASQDGTARLWDASTGRLAVPPLRHGGKVWWATFSPDGRWLATASEDRTARIWDARTGAPATAPLAHSEEVTYAAFSSDSQRLVTASGEAVARFWDFKDRPGEARVWDVPTGKPLSPPLPHKLSVFHAVFSPDSLWVATASHDHTARLWDARTGQPVSAPLLHREDVVRVAFSPDGHRLATASLDGSAKIWAAAKQQRHKLDLQDSWLGGAFRISPDGQWIAGKYYGSNGRIWNLRTGAASPLLYDTNILYMAFSPDSLRMATAGADGTARLWNATNGAPVGAPMAHREEVAYVAFSPDSQRVVTASQDHTARIWNASTGEPLTPALAHASNVLCVAFSPDGRRVATASEDDTARLWDSATGAPLLSPLAHSSVVCLVLFSPAGDCLATASWDGMVRVWNATSGAPLTPGMKHNGRFLMGNGIEQMAFSPDGQRLAVADDDGTARVWSVPSGLPITPPLKHKDRVFWTAFSHDGRLLVTASADKTARVWDAATGQPLTPWLAHDGAPDCATFANDDRALTIVGRAEKAGFVESWDLVPDSRPTAALLLQAQVLSLHHLDSSGAFAPLESGTITNASWSLQ